MTSSYETGSDNPLLGAVKTHHPELHTARRGAYRGGEGTDLLIEARLHDSNWLGRTWHWFRTLITLQGRSFPLGPLLFYSLYSTAAVAFALLYMRRVDDDWTSALDSLDIPAQTVGVALSLLLAFRTQASYDRWWEGANQWATLGAYARDLTRMTVGWDNNPKRQASLVHWTIAYVYAAKQALREDEDLAELREVLPPEDVARIVATTFRPTYIAAHLTKIINVATHEAKIPHPVAANFDSSVRGLLTTLTACLRIRDTPMPFAYVAHLRSFLLLWLMTTPFIFCATFGWWAILLAVIVAYAFLGLEECGHELEQPFGYDFNDLPLDHMTKLVRISMEELLYDELGVAGAELLMIPKEHIDHECAPGGEPGENNPPFGV